MSGISQYSKTNCTGPPVLIPIAEHSWQEGIAIPSSHRCWAKRLDLEKQLTSCLTVVSHDQHPIREYVFRFRVSNANRRPDSKKYCSFRLSRFLQHCRLFFYLSYLWPPMYGKWMLQPDLHEAILVAAALCITFNSSLVNSQGLVYGEVEEGNRWISVSFDHFLFICFSDDNGPS